jgi:hypothetical protein
MAESKIPPSERISASFTQLSTSTDECNEAAAELATAISKLDAALYTIKPVISAWHCIARHDDQDGSYWSREIGWAKVSDKWGIALKRTWGIEYADDHHEESWLFKDAPRWMAIEGAGKLPDLFEELLKRTRETTEKLKARTLQADELATALSHLLPVAKPSVQSTEPPNKAKGTKS